MKTNILDFAINEPASLGAKRIRHTLSSGLSFVETAVRNISSDRPDLPQALRLHAMGTQKLREAMIELDRLLEFQQDSLRKE